MFIPDRFTKTLRRSLTAGALLGAAGLIGFSPAAAGAQSDADAHTNTQAPSDQNDAELKTTLGERLFYETRFANPGTDFPTSCAACHQNGPNEKALRAYTDVLPRSLMPLRRDVGQIVTRRNTPTLLDVGSGALLNWDGEFDSLEALIRHKLTGRMFGWKPHEIDRALEAVDMVIVSDVGEEMGAEMSYPVHFKTVQGVDMMDLDHDEVVEWAVRELADYVRSLRSTRSSAYDSHVIMSRLPDGPGDAETPADYAWRYLGRLGNMSARQIVKLPQGFDELAYNGMKIFLATDGPAPVGNCVSCHTPPFFSDFKFHNTGVAQAEYDGARGSGSFDELVSKYAADPSAQSADHPHERYITVESAEEHDTADMGHGDFADPATSTQRLEGESETEFAVRMTGAFKTPTLRNLELTAPYMHNGAYESLEDALRQKIEFSRKVRAGEAPHADPEMGIMNISEDDIPALMAFLKQLRDLDPEGLRELTIHPHLVDYSLISMY